MLPHNEFSHRLLQWYRNNSRDLPWRHTNDPYKIWLSEIILQQTRVAQGLPYYLRFIEAYPTVYDLAAADENEVLRHWQGLGYYSRARNLHYTAKYIVDSLGGIFPDSYHGLLKLKGIGSYTAAAIASFAYEEKVAVLDGNVYRVLSRIFGIHIDISSTEASKEFTGVAQSLLPEHNIGFHNQAIMEFGALHCTPLQPLCLMCPFNDVCYAFLNNKQGELPVKEKKIKIRNRYFYYFIIRDQVGNIWMNQRKEQDIWQGLYDFFLIETSNSEDMATILETAVPAEFVQMTDNVVINHSIFKHILSHQKIFARFCEIIVYEELSDDKISLLFPLLKKFSLQEIQALPKPVLIDNYLKKTFL